MIMNENNKFALYIIIGNKRYSIYYDSFLLSPLESDIDLLKKGLFGPYRAAVLQRLETECTKTEEPEQPLALVNIIAGTLMRAICCINFKLILDIKRYQDLQPTLKANSRIAIFRTSIKESDASLYPSIVNAIFAAKKLAFFYSHL